MRRRNLDVLVAWLDAARRRDRDGMRALLSPDVSWHDVHSEPKCSTPDEVVELWLARAAALDDLDTVEMAADARRAALHLRAPSLARGRPGGGVHVGFDIDDGGRVTRMTEGERRSQVLNTDAAAVPHGIAEAPVRDGGPQAAGWFIVNVAEARWKAGFFGAYTTFEGDVPFEQIGVNIGVLEPGQPACWYHREGDQEDFLVLKGEALLLVEDEERRLHAWDFVHCPPWTEHVFVGAGERPCTILALGGRWRDGVVYPVRELALRHGAGVREQTTMPAEAYAAIAPDEPVAFDPEWLPDA